MSIIHAPEYELVVDELLHRNAAFAKDGYESIYAYYQGARREQITQ